MIYPPLTAHCTSGMRRAQFASGFTLVELMVVLVVLAIAGAMVGLAVSAGNGHALESAAERLSATLEETRWRAISTGRRIALEIPQAGSSAQLLLWYEQKQDGVWRIRESAGTDSPFTSVAIHIALPRPVADAPSRLVLGPEPVGAPACVLLSQDSNTVAVISNGVSPFAVRRDAGC